MAAASKIVQNTVSTHSFISALAALLPISTNNVWLKDWRSEMITAIELFLTEVKEKTRSDALKLLPLAISYAVDNSSSVDIEVVAQWLGETFRAVGMEATLCPLSDANTLSSQLTQKNHVIVLCTPEYAKQIERQPIIRQILDKFGGSKKNALQPLLCEGGFGDTALKIVDGHYLIRSYELALKRDPLTALPNFIDIFFNLSGNQGLGILPDILDLKETKNTKTETAYRATFNQLLVRQQQLTIDYRLKSSLTENLDNHPLKTYLEPTSFPVIKEESSPGFEPVIESLVNSSAKIGLLFCPSKADTQLTGLGLTTALLSQKRRVLAIDCADYPGQAAGDCVRLALHKMKLKNADIAAMKQEDMIILLRGYEDVGAYDNLWIKNKLSTWKNVKLLVTCESSFFRFRGYLSCFLADASNRQVDDLLVYKVPSFASDTAKKASLTPHNPSPLDSTEVIALSPRKKAERLELRVFIQKLNALWVEKGYLSADLDKNPQAFISYAWEADSASLSRQQGYLSQISEDLKQLGIPAWLDIERMSGDIDEQMAGNIANSQIVFVIGTPRYTERAQQDTNVKKEFDAILSKNNLQVFPLRFLKSVAEAGTLTVHILSEKNLPSNLQGCSAPAVLKNDAGDVTGLLVSHDGVIERKPAPTLDISNLLGEEKVALALDHLLVKALTANGQTLYEAFPKSLSLSSTSDFTGIDENYVINIAHPETGLIPKLILDSSEKKSLYQSLYTEFQKQLSLLAGKHLVVNQGQDNVLAFDMDNRLKGYIKAHGLYTPDSSLDTRFDLNQHFESFLQKPETRTTIVLGQAGSGKSAFALSTFKNLLKQWEGYQRGAQPLPTWLPVYIQLRNYSNNPENCIENALKEFLNIEEIQSLKQGLNHQQRILFICDGYDELDSGVRPNLSQSLAEWPLAKLLITGRPEHFDKNHQPLETLSAYSSDGKIILNSAEVVYVSPFVLNEIKDYVDSYKKSRQDDSNKAVYDNGYETLQNLPGMMALLDNPFLLTLVLQSLPQLLKNLLNIKRNVMRIDVYQAFTETWFNQETKGLDLNSKDCEAFVQELAFRFFQAKTISVSDIPEKKVIWDFFQADNNKAAQSVCPIRLSGGEYSFVHKSLYEYFTACRLWQALFEPDCINFWQVRHLTEERPIIDFLAEIYQSVPQEARLFNLVESSGNNNFPAIVSSNAITLLNAAQVSFAERDLSKIRIPRADLTDANCDGTNFNGADLSQVILERAWLNNAQFANALMRGVEFRAKPSLYLEGIRHSEQSISPDGHWLAIVTYNDGIQLYNTENNQLIKTLVGHKPESYSKIAFNAGGQLLVSATCRQDRTLRLWSIPTGECRVLSHDGIEDVESLAFSPDSEIIASGGKNSTIRLLFVSTGESILWKGNKEENILSLAFSPDGQHIVSGSTNGAGGGTIRLWSVNTGESRIVSNYATHCVIFSPDGTNIVSAEDEIIRVLSLATGELRVFEGHTDPVKSLAFSPDGRSILSGGFDNALRLWSVATGKCRVLSGHTSLVESVAFSLDGRTIISAGLDAMRFWSTTGTPHTGFGHKSEVCIVAVSPDGQRVVSGGDTLRFWSVLTGKSEIWEGHTNIVSSLAFSPDGQSVVSGSFDKTLRLWSVKTGKSQVWEGHTGMVSSVAFSPDGGTILSASEDGTLRLWSVATGKPTIFESEMEVFRAIFSPDRKTILVGNGNVLILFLPDNVRILEGHRSYIITLAFSPDGLNIVSGSQDYTARIWSIATGESRILDGHKSKINSVAFSPDGKSVVTASEDNTLRFWSFETGKSLGVFQMMSTVKTLCWQSPRIQTRETQLVTGQQDGAVSVWKIRQLMDTEYKTANEQGFQLTLLWRRALIPSGLTATGCFLNEELDKNNQMLLEQCGAVLPKQKSPDNHLSNTDVKGSSSNAPSSLLLFSRAGVMSGGGSSAAGWSDTDSVDILNSSGESSSSVLPQPNLIVSEKGKEGGKKQTGLNAPLLQDENIRQESGVESSGKKCCCVIV